MAEDMTYGVYLKLDQILSAQSPTSAKSGKAAHDETLFIIIHQVYELWFKQILHEIDSVREMFSGNTVDEKSIGIAVSRLQRVVEIQKLLVQQIQIIETMTPLDFLEFRGYLPGASGFQSMQFRMVENKLGLLPEARLQYANRCYHAEYAKKDVETVIKTEKEPSLFNLVEKWLERTPFLNHLDFDFLKVFTQAFNKMNAEDLNYIKTAQGISEEERTLRSRMNQQSKEYVESIIDETKYAEHLKEGRLRLSHKAFLAALFINLYRDQPILHLPFVLLSTILDIDEQLSLWRHRHSLMVLRMMGTKIGTGGSSGHEYLNATIQKHSIFKDLFMISSFYIPRSALPPLKPEVEEALGFKFTGSKR